FHQSETVDAHQIDSQMFRSYPSSYRASHNSADSAKSYMHDPHPAAAPTGSTASPVPTLSLHRPGSPATFSPPLPNPDSRAAKYPRPGKIHTNAIHADDEYPAPACPNPPATPAT